MLNKHTLLIGKQYLAVIHKKPPSQQSGVVMAVSLVLLLALTIIAITGTEVTGLEEKMAANSKDGTIAFEAADAALRAAEQSITNSTVSLSSFPAVANNGASGLYTTLSGCGTNTACTTAAPQSAYFNSIIWNTNTTCTCTTTTAGVASCSTPAASSVYATYTGVIPAGVCQPPTYIIELLKTTTTTNASSSLAEGSTPTVSVTVGWYRITARAVGVDANAVSILQSVYVH